MSNYGRVTGWADYIGSILMPILSYKRYSHRLCFVHTK